MKRVLVLAAVALVVVAAFVGQRLLNDDEPAPKTSSSSTDDRGMAQAKAQAEQLAAAMKDLEKRAEAASKPHELVVTIRDELPLEVWDSNCRLDRSSAAPTLGVLNDDYKPITDTVALPTDAKQLPDGGCEATIAVNVREYPAYHVGVVIEGRGISDGKEPPAIKREGKSQKVTIVE